MTEVSWSSILDRLGGSQAFEPLPVGSYDVRIAESTAKKASTGKNMLNVRFEVVSGPRAGRKFFHNFVLTTTGENADRAMSMFFRNMKLFGLDDAYFRANPPLDTVARDLLGKVCNVTVDHREWQGNIQENVKQIKAATPGMAAAATTPAGPANSAPVPSGLPQPIPSTAPPAAPPAPPAPPVAPPVPAYEAPAPAAVAPPTLPPPPPLPA
jgi:hypothetical protein